MMNKFTPFCIRLVTLTLVACVKPNPPLTDLKSEAHPNRLVNLASLTLASSQETWKEFFESYKASKLWQELQKNDQQFSINLAMIEGSPTPAQVNEVVTALIQYLSYHKPTIQTLLLLGIEGKKLHSLPPTIGKLTSLHKLYLSYNELTELPKEISHLTNLTRLDLTSNKLTDLPSSIGLSLSLFSISIHEARNLWLKFGRNLKKQGLERLSNKQLGLPLDELLVLVQGKRVIYFDCISKESGSTSFMPFYWDEEVSTYGDLKNMLEKLKGKQLYLSCKKQPLSTLPSPRTDRAGFLAI